MRIPTIITRAVAWAVFSVAGPGSAQPATDTSGIVIVKKLPDASLYAASGKEVSTPGRYDDSPEARNRRREAAKGLKVLVQIDRLGNATLDQKKDLVFRRLDTGTKHLFRVYDTAGNRQVSFYFTFKNARRNTVWLGYDAGYANWRIMP